jgi:hypothetical protein
VVIGVILDDRTTRDTGDDVIDKNVVCGEFIVAML